MAGHGPFSKASRDAFTARSISSLSDAAYLLLIQLCELIHVRSLGIAGSAKKR
jgi:hypothetical protein